MKILPFIALFLACLFSPSAKAQVSLDSTFGVNGRVTTPSIDTVKHFSGTIYGLAIQNDGKVIAVGQSFTNYGNNRSYITVIRYNIDGSLDSNFGNNGIDTLYIDIANWGNKVQLQNDGKIIIVGTATNDIHYQYDSSTIVIMRLNTNGTYDSTFGKNGKVKTNLGLFSSANDIKIQTDGKIIITGASSFNNIQLFNKTLAEKLYVVRYKINGVIDSSFGKYGVATIPWDSASNGIALAIQDDKKILILGTFSDSANNSLNSNNYAFVLRFDTTGVLDSSYGNNGILSYISKYHYYGSDIVLQKDGKAVIVGSVYDSTYSVSKFGLSRLTVSGALDTSFNKFGIVTQDFGVDAYNEFYSINLQPDGKFLAAGLSEFEYTNECFLLERFNTDGTLDSSIGIRGADTTTFPRAIYAFAFAAALQKDGKVILGGSITDDYTGIAPFALARFILPTKQNDGITEPKQCSINQMSIYPNPTGDYANLKYSLNTDQPVTIALNDIKGNLVRTVTANTMQSKGAHTVTVSLKNLAAGSYVISVKSGESQNTLKIVKQ